MREIPVAAVGVPKEVLQPLPEVPRLSNAPDLMPASNNCLSAIFFNEVFERCDDSRLRVFEVFIVRSVALVRLLDRAFLRNYLARSDLLRMIAEYASGHQLGVNVSETSSKKSCHPAETECK